MKVINTIIKKKDYLGHIPEIRKKMLAIEFENHSFKHQRESRRKQKTIDHVAKEQKELEEKIVKATKEKVNADAKAKEREERRANLDE
ncbi:hypothetical protein L2E82_44720 [Cichorium intybus]|uniref:Uncharacterized protein n=1 Tax=Cichorium intybus TaxID=13427 RepID=A0ACB8ZRZ6_CICIN|nr:hypothetical protein L2E82_44720 [Cichorium intybus]